VRRDETSTFPNARYVAHEAISICHHSGFGRVVRESGRRYRQAL